MTKDYEKPSATPVLSASESIYMASGENVVVGEESNNSSSSQNGTLVCESAYIKGNYRHTDYSGDVRSNIDVFGCNGCNADRGNGCAYALGIENTNYTSYLNDKGHLKPAWEQQGKGPYDNAW